MTSPQFDPAIDLATLRARYRAERDRRLRPPDAEKYTPADEGEFAFYADDPYAVPLTREPVHDRVEALVLGGGLGGLVAAARLRQAGLERIRVIERGGDFGGTWYWNRFPGVHCDIESYVYLPLLEELRTVPAWKYSPGEEIRQHCMAIGRHFDLYRDACFQTSVTELRWEEDTGEWLVRTNRDDRIRARFVVVTNGNLDRPKLPNIPGVKDFRGHTFHTSRWDHAYTGPGLANLADKRVGIIGTGATAVQVVPHLAAASARLTVFQRTPSSVDVRGNRRTDPAWAASLSPGWQRERRDNFLALVSGGHAEPDLVADGWTASAALLRTMTAGLSHADLDPAERARIEELADAAKMNEIRARVDALVTDPATAELLKPWYRYACKRPTFSDEYLQSFNRPNVTLVDTADHGGVTGLTETGVLVGEREYELDCLVFATGFSLGTSDVRTGRVPVHGRTGTLLEHWAHGPRSLHGLYSHGFPNLFHLGGLQSAASVNYAHILDEQATHLAEIVGEARKRGARWVEPSAAAEDAWLATIQSNAQDNLAYQSDCTPGYYNNEGHPIPFAVLYGPGAAAFHTLLREWREGDGLAEVLVTD
ncbi:cation diffusion facilitator CzcD-associated flavoprotein CzcO [Crossiella equi]|uniref:Cation diffusion facilitator CzcD-associated flavoprotein CzcO n=1 Tax=Crossiella equi TaxID=130796 RepID=A0ABS5APL2_9PSEU|nr:NAD(P)/FAD-dependent oxidoreductase [Crossiella equi]MBP2478503.1 cation diffusion facilitator CzcD-associated flavoprotein CzcO [Crossiella equi]